MQDIQEKIISIVYSGGLGVLGQLATLLYKNNKGEEFLSTRWMISLCLAFIVSRIIGEFIPLDTFGRDGILGIAGAVSIPIMDILMEYGAKWILKRVGIEVPEKK